MSGFLCFAIGLAFSFIGSVPPGTINITTLQYAIANKKAAAMAFATGATLVEFFYALAAVRFQLFLTENTSVSSHFQLISGCLLLILGTTNLIKRHTPNPAQKTGERRNAFKKGLLIGLANPMSIPFWLAVTSYLQHTGWVNLAGANTWLYLVGISAGTLLLLALITKIGPSFSAIQHNKLIVYRIPGLIFIVMGIYTFYQ